MHADRIERSEPGAKGPWSQRCFLFRPIAAWALALGLCLPARASGRPGRVSFKTSDGVRIAADYRAPSKGKPVFVLLHGLGSGKGEWSAFSGMLSERGWGSLALDARGHAASGGARYETFRTPEDWARIELDLEAALSDLRARGIGEKRAVLGGASIGANLALRVAARHPAVPLVLLFSPGLNYQGVGIEQALDALQSPVILAAAPDDPYAYRTAQWFEGRMRGAGSRFLRAASGHGVRMLEGEANRPFVDGLLRCVEDLLKVKPSSPSSSGTRASP